MSWLLLPQRPCYRASPRLRRSVLMPLGRGEIEDDVRLLRLRKKNEPLRWFPGAARSTRAGRFDLDHVGSHVRQNQSGSGTGDDLSHFDDANSFQRQAAHGVICSRGFDEGTACGYALSALDRLARDASARKTISQPPLPGRRAAPSSSSRPGRDGSAQQTLWAKLFWLQRPASEAPASYPGG
jgi:hypothetical protein